MLGVARVHPGAHFHWAPFDTQWEYSIAVEVDGRELTRDEVRERYRIAPTGINVHSIEFVFQIVRQYEETYGRDDGAAVTVQHRTNGRNPQTWLWPRP